LKNYCATKELTNKPFGANLFAMNRKALEFAAVVAKEGIGAVTVSGGSPKQLIPFLRERGVKVLLVAPTVDSACKAEVLGADAIVAEGSESGGVQGFGGPSMEDSWIKGNVNVGILPAGQISGLVKDILSVKDVICEMVG
jgi:NAD(P)H-dependent flavin oxidoreductase YrpB (nitropropane dioxygenase family)